jgi:hypothetical protein
VEFKADALKQKSRTAICRPGLASHRELNRARASSYSAVTQSHSVYHSPTRSTATLGGHQSLVDALLCHSASEHPNLTLILYWSSFSRVVLKHSEPRRIVPSRRDSKGIHKRLATPKDDAVAGVLHETLQQLGKKPKMRRDVSRLSSACRAPEKYELLQTARQPALRTQA